MEAWLVRNVWPGNSKNPQAQAERIVPFVYPASTRTFQTCHRASSAHVGMRNRLRNKRRALNAAPVNSMTMLVPLHANHVSIKLILEEKEETAVASTVPRVGLPKTAVRNVSRVVQEHSALLLVKIVKIAWRVNIVPVNMKMVLIRIQLRASVVPLVSQLLVKVVLNVKRAVLERSVLGVKIVL
jgi:hypothetical protein